MQKMDTINKKILDEIPQAAQSHLNMLQAIIQRMSTNCTSCKTWCVTLVSGLMVVLFTNSKIALFPAILVPIILFFVLDSYYLALEKGFRDSHNSFIKKMHDGTLEVSDLFVMAPSGNATKSFFKAVSSFSIWPFYLTLFLLNIFIYIFLF